MKVFLGVAQKIVLQFVNSREVKEFVVRLLEQYAKSTDNSLDNVAVDMVKKSLLGE